MKNQKTIFISVLTVFSVVLLLFLYNKSTASRDSQYREVKTKLTEEMIQEIGKSSENTEKELTKRGFDTKKLGGEGRILMTKVTTALLCKSGQDESSINCSLSGLKIDKNKVTASMKKLKSAIKPPVQFLSLRSS